MTLRKALWLIAIGTVLLAVIAGFALVAFAADGTAFALALALVLSIGGVANALATMRYGSPAHRRR